MRETKNKIAGYALGATALIACPCHLALTLPLALTLLGGTALGAALTAHTGLLVAAMTVYFVVALAAAIHLLKRSSRDPAVSEAEEQARSRNSLAREAESGVGR